MFTMLITCDFAISNLIEIFDKKQLNINKISIYFPCNITLIFNPYILIYHLKFKYFYLIEFTDFFFNFTTH